ncbi:MAG: response regulator [Desulfobacteraceae bacterium]|nr:response regulator [Desulfobacteraceae bacterium]
MVMARKILVVDDDPPILEMVCELLTANGFPALSCSTPEKALAFMELESFDAVLTDINMPGINGLDLLEKIHVRYPDIPVILMTAGAELNMTVKAIRKGTFDFIMKPFNPVQLIHSVEKAVNYFKLLQMEKDYKHNLEETVRQRTREVQDASKEMIVRLIVAAEYRDDETGNHIRRLGLYAKELAETLRMPPDFIESITFASAMHDIGKIGIPDAILLKPGPYTSEEFEVMKNHTIIGNKILSGSAHANIQMASSIALCHHERWDGSGYPFGLKSEAIPIEGRIVMLADQYEALRSERPYKPALEHKDVVRILLEGDDRTMPGHFDPQVLAAFSNNTGKFEEIFSSLA